MSTKKVNRKNIPTIEKPTASGRITCAAVMEIAEQLRKEGFMYRVSVIELDKRMARHMKAKPKQPAKDTAA